MNTALQSLLGKKVELEADGVGKVRGTLKGYDHPRIHLDTEKERSLYIPVARIFYIQSV